MTLLVLRALINEGHQSFIQLSYSTPIQLHVVLSVCSLVGERELTKTQFMASYLQSKNPLKTTSDFWKAAFNWRNETGLILWRCVASMHPIYWGQSCISLCLCVWVPDVVPDPTGGKVQAPCHRPRPCRFWFTRHRPPQPSERGAVKQHCVRGNFTRGANRADPSLSLWPVTERMTSQ